MQDEGRNQLIRRNVPAQNQAHLKNCLLLYLLIKYLVRIQYENKCTKHTTYKLHKTKAKDLALNLYKRSVAVKKKGHKKNGMKKTAQSNLD